MSTESTNGSKNVLLVIDIQKQFNYPRTLYKKCLDFIAENQDEYDAVIGTVFKNTLPNFYVHLDWSDCADASIADIEYKADAIIIKNTYAFDLNDIQQAVILNNGKDFDFKDIWNVGHFDIIGSDADACVLATAYKLWDADKDFTLLTDYIYSSSMPLLIPTFELMRRNFGDCVVK